MPKLVAQDAIDHFIRARVYWFGRVSRQDVVGTFGVSTAYASRQLTQAHNEVGMIEAGKGHVLPQGVTEPPDGVSSDKFLTDLYHAALTRQDPTPACGGEVPHVAIDAFRRHVRPEVLRPLVLAMEQCATLDIEYIGMNVGDEPKARTIEPLRLVHVNGRWHVNAFCQLAGDRRDFVLSRILSAQVGSRVASTSPMNDFALATCQQRAFKAHPALSAQQREVVEFEFGMTDGQLVIELSDSELFYFEQQFVALSEQDAPPHKLLVRSPWSWVKTHGRAVRGGDS